MRSNSFFTFISPFTLPAPFPPFSLYSLSTLIISDSATMSEPGQQEFKLGNQSVFLETLTCKGPDGAMKSYVFLEDVQDALDTTSTRLRLGRMTISFLRNENAIQYVPFRVPCPGGNRCIEVIPPGPPPPPYISTITTTTVDTPLASSLNTLTPGAAASSSASSSANQVRRPSNQSLRTLQRGTSATSILWNRNSAVTSTLSPLTVSTVGTSTIAASGSLTRLGNVASERIQHSQVAVGQEQQQQEQERHKRQEQGRQEQERQQQEQQQEQRQQEGSELSNFNLLLQSKMEFILSRNFEILQGTSPRLFIILPDEEIMEWDSVNLSRNKFRLHFVCDCGQHTKTPGRNMISHHLHLAKHKGYEIRQATKFFANFSRFLRVMLEIIKRGAQVDGYETPALSELIHRSTMDESFWNDSSSSSNILARVDKSILFLDELLKQSLLDEFADISDTEVNEAPDIKALEMFFTNIRCVRGTELQQHFIDIGKSQDHFGGFYNMMITKGTKQFVKWICKDHYRNFYSTANTIDFQKFISARAGQGLTFVNQSGTLEISLSSSKEALNFFSLMNQMDPKIVFDLKVEWNFHPTFSDLVRFKEMIFELGDSIQILGNHFVGQEESTTRFHLFDGQQFDLILKIMGHRSIKFFSVGSNFFKSENFLVPLWLSSSLSSLGTKEQFTHLQVFQLWWIKISKKGLENTLKNLKYILTEAPNLKFLNIGPEYEQALEVYNMTRNWTGFSIEINDAMILKPSTSPRPQLSSLLQVMRHLGDGAKILERFGSQGKEIVLFDAHAVAIVAALNERECQHLKSQSQAQEFNEQQEQALVLLQQLLQEVEDFGQLPDLSYQWLASQRQSDETQQDTRYVQWLLSSIEHQLNLGSNSPSQQENIRMGNEMDVEKAKKIGGGLRELRIKGIGISSIGHNAISRIIYQSRLEKFVLILKTIEDYGGLYILQMKYLLDLEIILPTMFSGDLGCCLFFLESKLLNTMSKESIPLKSLKIQDETGKQLHMVETLLTVLRRCFELQVLILDFKLPFRDLVKVLSTVRYGRLLSLAVVLRTNSVMEELEICRLVSENNIKLKDLTLLVIPDDSSCSRPTHWRKLDGTKVDM